MPVSQRIALAVYLTPEDHERLDALARERDIPMSAIVRDLVRTELRRHELEPAR